MQNQVTAVSGKGTNGVGASKAPGATIVAKAGPPPAKEPKAGVTSQQANEAPRISNPGAFLIGKEILIYSPPGSFLNQVYNEASNNKEPTIGEFRCTLLDASFEPLTGAPQWGIIQYRQRGARLYENRDLVPLLGCSISILVERQIEDEPAEPIKK